MEQYRKLIQKLIGELGMYNQQDGFQSTQLRREILFQLTDLRLPAAMPMELSRPEMDGNSLCRLNYLSQARKTGENVARKMVQDELPDSTAPYLYDMILAGAGFMGREIARGYAVELYPELERLREQHVELPVTAPAVEPERRPNPPSRYGFIVETNPYFINIGEITPMAPEANWKITHDELGETYTETFVFDTRKEAEENHSRWENFRDNDSRQAPVEYMIRINTNSNGKNTVSEIFHSFSLPPDHASASSKTLRFQCLGDAVKHRRQIEEKNIYDQSGFNPEISFYESPGDELLIAEPPDETALSLPSQKETPPVISK